MNRKKKQSGLFAGPKERAAKAIADEAVLASEAARARLAAAALLELARARHHLRRSSDRLEKVVPPPIDPKTGKPTKIGFEDWGLGFELGRGPHPTPHTPLPSHEVLMSHHTDLPPELGSYSDGVSDSAMFTPEIIGCGADCRGSVGGSLSDIAVGAHHGIPSYLLTKRGLSNASVRSRIADNIRAMTPKLRRRVLGRLRQAVLAARQNQRVSGEVRSAYPTVAGGGWSMVSGPSISVGRCPYANVAGAFTP